VPKPELRLINTSFAGRADLGTGVSAAIMRRVARGEFGPTMRIHRTGPILAFGRLDKLRPGYGRAVAIAREQGFEPIERLAGGRAAVFHEGTISFSLATRERSANTGTHARFAAMAETVADALGGLGIDARVGEVPGEYCPGDYSVNARGAAKLAGIGQRVITAGAHVGGVLVVRGAARTREILEPVYEALETDWDPATSGSVAAELGEPDDPFAPEEPDPMIARVIDSLRDALGERWELVDAELDEPTMRLAEELRDRHAAPR
jgi:lipoate-protein ligase A